MVATTFFINLTKNNKTFGKIKFCVLKNDKHSTFEHTFFFDKMFYVCVCYIHEKCFLEPFLDFLKYKCTCCEQKFL